MTYNGYATQDAWHEALAARFEEYAAARREGLARNPEGWRHAECDHASGYCQWGEL
jgi:hypothetical protein